MTLKTLLSFYTQGEVKRIDSSVSSACGCTHYICGNFFILLSVFSFLVFSKRAHKGSRSRTITIFSNINSLLSWFSGCLPIYAIMLSFLKMILCLPTHPFCVWIGGAQECCKTTCGFEARYCLYGKRQVGSGFWTFVESQQCNCS